MIEWFFIYARNYIALTCALVIAGCCIALRKMKLDAARDRKDKVKAAHSLLYLFRK